MHPVAFRLALAVLATAFLAGARPGSAADLNLTLPSVSGIPGSLVDVPIQATPGPAGLGILSIDFRLALDPAVAFGSNSKPDGFLQNWGTAYSNGTNTFLAAAAAGTTPIGSAGTLLNTVQVRIKPGAVIGTDMPLTLSRVLFNEGTPTVAVTSGVLHVIAPAASAPAPAPGAFALALVSPSPARETAAFACTVPGGTGARLVIFGIDGRRVRTFEVGAGAASAPVRWDLHNAAGARVRPGVYLARLDRGGERLVRRVVVLD